MTERDYENRLQAYLNRLNGDRRVVLSRIPKVKFLELTDKERQADNPCEGYGQRSRVTEDWSGWEDFSCETTWGGPDYHCVFGFEVVLTKEMEGQPVGVSLDTGATDIWNTDNPQIMVYVNGELTCAMDLNHNEVMLSDCAVSGSRYDIRLYAYVNSAGRSNFLYLNVFAVRPEPEKLYYDMKAPLEAALLLQKGDSRRETMLAILHKAGDLLDLRETGSEVYLASLKAADDYLQQELYEKEWESDGAEVYAIGHTHIDVAWKWPLRQTREKAVRSFSTVLYLMDRYPEYRFMSSQPQLYQYVKEEAPQLYEKIREKVKEGRWETEGAMWLESDCNLTSGESLIRQILQGRKFFAEEFGTEKQEVLWLPDAFGFLGALPQIMKRSGIRYFMTTKLGWNESDQQPDDTFYWEGIDGSKVLGIYVTTKNYETYPERFDKPVRETTYNGRQNANQIMGTWQNYRNKRINQTTMTLYGYGDGGGGPTMGMLEESRRLKHGIPGVPKVKLAGVGEYFQRLSQNLEGKQVNTWYGDLYLEYHRGTFTSIAENKKQNRLCEYGIQEAEWLSAMAYVLAGSSYPAESLERAWKLLLLNQFHDILPGSAIGEVYEQSQKDYREIAELDGKMASAAKASVLAAAGLKPVQDSAQECAGKLAPASRKLAVWNPLGFAANCVVELPRQNGSAAEIADSAPVGFAAPAFSDASGAFAAGSVQLLADGSQIACLPLPAKGYAVFDPVSEEQNQAAASCPFELTGENELETPWYQVRWNERGELVSLYDRQARRQVLAEGTVGNCLRIYEDIPKEYDAWNIDSYYERKFWKAEAAEPCRLREAGAVCAVLHTVLSYRNSVIEQDIIFYAHTRRIDFRTRIDWKEQQQLLKAGFSLDVMTKKAVCEIPYGTIERPTHRNTSWERAKFEMCAHRFVDLSEPGYGAALLNDGRYGYSVQDSDISLTLLTSGIFPYPDADKGVHTVTYALLPHMGDYRTGNVVKEAYLLNWKPQAGWVEAENGCCAGYSMLSFDRDNVFADAVKLAEDGDGLIVRVYEAHGQREQVNMDLSSLPVRDVWECDLMEHRERAFALEERKVSFLIKPFEIKTFRITLSV